MNVTMRRTPWAKLKQSISIAMAAVVFITSIPPIPVLAGEEWILDEEVLEGNESDLTVHISHELKAGNTEADIYVSSIVASASNAQPMENMDIQVELKDSHGRRIKGGEKGVDAQGEEAYRFRVKKNDTYTAYVYYSEAEDDIQDDIIMDEDDIIIDEDEIIEETTSKEESKVESSPANEDSPKETDATLEESREAETEEAETEEAETEEAETEEAETEEAETEEAETEEAETESEEMDSEEVTPLALRVMDFFFPVMEAYAATKEKVLVYEYEINDLYEKGNETEISFSVELEEKEQGAKVKVTASPSNAETQTNGSILGITILADKDDAFYQEAEARAFEYQDVEYDMENGSATFYISQNGPYYIGILYSQEEETERNLKSVLIPYKVESKNGVRYLGVDDITIIQGETFDLMSGVQAVDANGVAVNIGIVGNNGFDPMTPGTYVITYAPLSAMRKRGGVLNDTHQRTIRVLAATSGDLTVSSNIHGSEAGKTLEILPYQRIGGVFTIEYNIPQNQSERYLGFQLPEWITIKGWPTAGFGKVEADAADPNTTMYKLPILDGNTSTSITFELQYEVDVRWDHIPGGKNAYIDDLGITNIGNISFSAGIAEVETNRCQIGEFTTAPMDENTEIIKTPLLFDGKEIYKSHSAESNASGVITLPSLPVWGGNDEKRFRLGVIKEEGLPYRIEHIRVFAPKGFQFTLGSASDKITLGTSNGIWYADVTDPLQSFEAINQLMIESQGNLGANSTFDSPPSIITYTCFSQNKLVQKTYETTPLLHVQTGHREVYTEGDTLSLFNQINTEFNPDGTRTFYVKESYDIADIQVSNQPKVQSVFNNTWYYTAPQERGNGLVVRVTIPGTNQIEVTSIRMSKGQLFNYPVGTAKVNFKEVIVNLTDGRKDQVGTDGLYIDLSTYQDRDKIESIDFVFNDLYLTSAQIRITGKVAKTVEPTLPLEGRLTDTKGKAEIINQTGAVIKKDDKIPHQILMKPVRGWMVYEVNGYSVSSAVQQNIPLFKTTSGEQGVGVTLQNVTYTMDFSDVDETQQSLIRYFYWTPMGSEKVTMVAETAKGKTLTYEFDGKPGRVRLFMRGSTGGSGSAALPDPEDLLKKLTVTFSDMTKTSSSSTTLLEMAVGTDSQSHWNELAEYCRKQENTSISFPIKTTVSSDEWEVESEYVRSHTILTRLTADKQQISVGVPSKETMYEGDSFDYTLPMYQLNYRGSIPSSNFRWPWLTYTKQTWEYPDTYVFLGDENRLLLKDVEAPWKYDRISTADGTVLRLYRDDRTTIPPLGSNGQSNTTGSLPSPKLTFQVLYGGTTTADTFLPVREVWYDMKKIQDLEEVWMRDHGFLLMHPKAWFEAGTGLTEHDVLKISDPADFPGVKIAKSAQTGIFLTAGVDGSLTGNKAEGKSKSEFIARVTMETAGSSYQGYEAGITLPRAGSQSDFSLYLTGPLTVASQQGTKLKARYQLDGGTAYLEEGAVSDWKQVAKIQIIPQTGTEVANGTSQAFVLSMNTKDKVGFGTQSASLKAEYTTATTTAVSSNVITYDLNDYNLKIENWVDENENGQKNTGEPSLPNLEIGLMKNGVNLSAGTDYKKSVSTTDNRITIQIPNASDTELVLSKRTLPSKYVLLPPSKSASVFDKETGIFSIPVIKKDQNYLLGTVKLGTVSVENVQVKEGLKTPINTRWSEVSPQAPTGQYTYAYTMDTPGHATIAGGTVIGVKNGFTGATLKVTNRFGDEVNTNFGIQVATNTPPMVNAKNWTVIQGDTIDDIWEGVFYADPEDVFPTTRMGGDALRSVVGKKTTIWQDPRKTSEISLDEALANPGVYTITYQVTDQDLNQAEDDATLTVYGMLKAPISIPSVHLFLPETGGLTAPALDFTYLDANHIKTLMQVSPAPVHATGKIAATYSATHPMAASASQGVTPGSGRTATTQRILYVDSKPMINGVLAKPITLIEGTDIDLMAGVSGTYNHYDTVNESGQVVFADMVFEDQDGNGITAPLTNLTPGVYTYTYTATANETYDHGDINQTTVTSTIHVIGKMAIQTDKETIYVTPDQADREDIIKAKVNVSASFIDTHGNVQTIGSDSLSYAYEKIDRVITKVTISGSVNVDGVINSASSKEVKVVVRTVPTLSADPILLRQDASLDPSTIAVLDGVTMSPNDNFNSFAVKEMSINPSLIGRYEAFLVATDSLTGADSHFYRSVYVNGNPKIEAMPASLFTHESTGEEALIAAVKKGAPTATVTFTMADGTVKKVAIDSNDIQYEVAAGYEAGKEGTYQVTMTVLDTNVLNQSDLVGLTAATSTLTVGVTVSNQSYQLEIKADTPEKGTFEEGNTFYPAPVIHGQSITTLPTPKPEEGFHFNGYQIASDVKTKNDITLGDGSVIHAGGTVPGGSILTEDQIKNLVIEGIVELRAVFSASPVVAGNHVSLYEGEAYDSGKLNIQVSDLDDPNGTDGANIVIDDSHVDGTVAGTYQVKVTVTDAQGNETEAYFYVQVLGKPIVETNTDVILRAGDTLTADMVAANITAGWLKPESIPTSPWADGDKSNTTVTTEAIPVTAAMVGTLPSTGSVGRKTVEVTIPGTIAGNAAAGSTKVDNAVYVQGIPVLSASEVNLYTHESISPQTVIDEILKNTSASVEYVMLDGTTKTVSINAADIGFQVDAGFVAAQEGTFDVVMTVQDSNVLDQVDMALAAAQTSILVKAIVSDRKYNITITDGDTGKGTFEEGSIFNPGDISHGQTLPTLPTPKPEDGFHFDGYEIGKDMVTKEEITLSDGTVIPPGGTVPEGSILTEEQVKDLIVDSDVVLEAVFSASPVIAGNHVSLYEGEAYDSSKLNIRLSDLDDPKGTDGANIVIDDSHVDGTVAGTYQVKVTVTDAQGNETEVYFYVQVFGKTEITTNMDLHTRVDDEITFDQIRSSLQAVYKKPVDIPVQPWAEEEKTNQIVTEKEITLTESMIESMPEFSLAAKKQLKITIPGMIGGEEAAGSTLITKDIYIYGMPVIVADYNELSTHLAVSEESLIETIKTGVGSGINRQPASAYVEIPLTDGTLERKAILESNIRYEVRNFNPNTEGVYPVALTVDDQSIMEELGLNAKGLGSEHTTLERGVTVGDKIYNVTFNSGENGTYEGGDTIIVPILHGKTPLTPQTKPAEGYLFAGWQDQSGNIIADIANYVITDDTTITAVFEKQLFTVQFIGRNDQVIKVEQVPYGENATAPTDHPDVTHERFKGWDTVYTNVKKDLMIYAIYFKPPSEDNETSGGGGGGNTGGGETGGGETGGGNEPGTETVPDNGGNTDSGSDGDNGTPIPPTFTIDGNKTPYGNITIPSALPENIIDGSDLPALDANQSIVNKSNRSIGSIRIEKVGKDNGSDTNDSRQAGQDSIQIFQEKVPVASKPKYLLHHGKSCFIHLFYLIAAALGAIYQLLRMRKNKKELEELDEMLEKKER